MEEGNALTMKIALATVGKIPKAVSRSFEAREIDLTGEIISLDGPVSLTGQLARDDARVELTAKLEGDANIICTRCLVPVRKRLDVDFRDVFVEPVSDSEATDAEISAQDLDESITADGMIDLADVVREQILLALPEQVFCKEDCRGLCPQCGENLNLIDCNCADAEVDPRWAALRDLR